ncbi:hypothetical protein ACTPEL_12180, partial [Clostridioides difficile]
NTDNKCECHDDCNPCNPCNPCKPNPCNPCKPNPCDDNCGCHDRDIKVHMHFMIIRFMTKR